MLRATATTRDGQAGSAARSWSSHELAERQQRMAGEAFDLGRARAMAEHERLGRGAVKEPHRHPRVRGMRERALALDEQELATSSPTLDHEALRRSGDEVGDDRIDGDAPAGDRDPRLPGRDELRCDASSAGRPIELQRDRHLPDRAVRSDGEHAMRRDADVLTQRAVEIGRGPTQISKLDTRVCEPAPRAPGRR